VLAAYVTFDAVKSLILREAPTRASSESCSRRCRSSCAVARRAKRTSRAINSRAMMAEASQTQLCVPSAILLAGLGLNALFGWWWADPVAAGHGADHGNEGREALRGDECTCHS
jgi:hypothetical protein